MRFTLNKAFILTVALTSTFALSGCTNASQTLAGPTGGSTEGGVPTEQLAAAPLDAAAAALLPADVKASGVLKVATDPTYPPYELYAADNKTVVGFDADLAAAIGQALGLTVEMVPATFDTILPGIASKKYDIGMSAFSVTPERQLNADFVAYQVNGSGLAVPPKNPKNLSLDAMSLCGMKVAGQKGTTQGIQMLPDFSKKCTDAGKKAIDIQLFPSQSEANLALVSGRVDAVAADSISMAYQGKLAGGTFELASGKDFEPVPTAVALPKGSALTPAIAAAVKSLIKGSTYTALFTKWGMPVDTMVTVDQVDSK